MLALESPTAPSRKKICKHYRQGRCQLEKGCIFLHPQEQQSKSLIKAPDTSTSLSCRPDSPLERPNGEEDDNTSLEGLAHEIGDINDNTVHDESHNRMDQADVEFNKNHPDLTHPCYDDEAYREQPDNDPSNPSHRTDSVDRDVEETCANHVEPVNASFKPSNSASYCGDGWEERSSPPPATQLQTRQRVALPVVPPPPKYPHVLDVIPHWTQFADPRANKDVPFCKQLARRECSQSYRCRFRHSLTFEEYTLLFNDQQPNLWTLELDGVNEVSSPTSEPQVDSPHIFSAIVPKHSAFDDQECKFYPIGRCRNGSLCPFKHPQHPTAPVATVWNAEQGWKTSKRPAFGTDTQNSQRPCQFHFEHGHCNRGLSCKFSHGNADGNHPSSGPSGPESALSLVNDDEGGWGKANNNNSNADTPAEDNGWGSAAAASWDVPSNVEDHSAWDSPSRNDNNRHPRPRNSNVCFQFVEGNCHRGMACKYSHDQEFSNKTLSSEAPKTENDGWPSTDDSSHSPWNIAPPAQCPYYLKGNCRNDTFCHMSHDSKENQQEGSRSEELYKAENPTNESEEVVQNETESTQGMERAPKTLSDNEPKAQEGESEVSQILDNEATWSESNWHTETAQPPPFPIKIYAPCKRFGQGYCPFKDDCTYLHIIEDSDIVEHTNNSERDVSVSIFLKRCSLAI